MSVKHTRFEFKVVILPILTISKCSQTRILNTPLNTPLQFIKVMFDVKVIFPQKLLFKFRFSRALFFDLWFWNLLDFYKNIMSASVNFEELICISTFCIAVTFTFTNIFTYFFTKLKFLKVWMMFINILGVFFWQIFFWNKYK